MLMMSLHSVSRFDCLAIRIRLGQSTEEFLYCFHSFFRLLVLDFFNSFIDNLDRDVLLSFAMERCVS